MGKTQCLGGTWPSWNHDHNTEFQMQKIESKGSVFCAQTSHTMLSYGKNFWRTQCLLYPIQNNAVPHNEIFRPN